MGKIYSTDSKISQDSAQIQIGDRLFAVDCRKSNYDKMQKALAKNESGKSDEDIILEFALGKEAFAQIQQMDLSLMGHLNLITYIYAAMFGIEFEEAQERFRKAE